MGLGKSLTTLATILGSLDYARGSVGPQVDAEAGAAGQLYPAKTTLIVVPLSCKFIFLQSRLSEVVKLTIDSDVKLDRGNQQVRSAPDYTPDGI